ncbi:hypothetical protein IWQ56_000291 [Coemansia nantahalensis]|nr:hypothetical protein IWQ56_000291 [Coemansia nantahalensis]
MAAPGTGRLDCRVVAGRVVTTAASAYPLKIMTPRAAQAGPSAGGPALHPVAAYLLTYGGGLVHGDTVTVHVCVEPQVALVLLTQGSTKVYRTRGQPAPEEAAGQSVQTLEIGVAAGALVCVLPDPVTCFEDARYSQRQRVRLAAGASLVLLDWMTSGRMSRGERWCFARYFSVNAVCAEGGRLAIRDALLLDDPRALRDADVDALAYLLALGPAAAAIADRFRREHRDARIRPARTAAATRPDVRWSVSEVDTCGVRGVAVRAAAASTAELRAWLVGFLAPLRAAVGAAAWSMFANT